MKADFSTWTHSPENVQLLKAYAELAVMEGLCGDAIPKIVWRDGELTLTLNPKEDEQTYEPVVIIDRRKKPEEEELITFIEPEEEEERGTEEE